MEKYRGCFLFSQRKGKMVRNKENIDSNPVHRSADYGHVGDGCHHIHFSNWDFSILHGERQRFTWQWNCDNASLDNAHNQSIHCVLQECCFIY